MKAELLAEVMRGEIVESVHYGAFVVADKDGKYITGLGDPDYYTYMRSAAKPMQALPVLTSGAAKHFDLTHEEIALLMASHGGEEVHVNLGMRIMEKIGLASDLLQCGTHYPLHSASARALIAGGQLPTVFHCTCSGKHAGMLALAQYYKMNLENYFLPEHPVQKMMLESMAEFAALKPAEIALGVDGCGVPVFALSLRQMASAYARWAEPSAWGEEKAAACRIMHDAMTGFPTVIAGTGLLPTKIMKITGRKLLVKDGTEGIVCVGIPEKGWGIALKIADGNARAAGPVIIRILQELGVLTAVETDLLGSIGLVKLKNHKGDLIGEIRPAFSLG